MEEIYKKEFYANRHDRTLYSAETILNIVTDIVPEINSAADFGCGVGTWLHVLGEKGAEKVQGVDGPWVDTDLLRIPKTSFFHADLNSEIKLEQRYDLAISVEVAEHLEPESAENFVNSLTNTSDFILFSAAVPFQGGRNHINEQWPEYWAKLFKEKGYSVVDLVRKKIWNDDKIERWYKQNIFLYVKKEKLSELKATPEEIALNNRALPLIHPESYLSKVEKMTTLKGSFKIFRNALKKSLGISKK